MTLGSLGRVRPVGALAVQVLTEFSTILSEEDLSGRLIGGIRYASPF